MSKISRRHFVERTGAGLVAATSLPLGAQEKKTQAPTAATPRTTITFTLNGTARTVEVEDHWTLVELLRDHLQLTGTKLGCDRSECGACTVIIDGKTMYSCTQLAAWMDGKTILTVE